MGTEFVERFFLDAKQFAVSEENWVHLSYREFVAFFAEREVLTESDVIIGSYFTYGWMPTMLELRGDLLRVVEIANRVKRREEIDSAALLTVAEAVNRSVVGASKLLHFINPHDHAIWDSRVYRYLYLQTPYPYRMEPHYWDYLESLRELSSDDRFRALKFRISEMIGYEITDFRAAEMVMFKFGEKQY